MQLIARPIRHRLGAEELVELGRARSGLFQARSPFLANRPQLGRGVEAEIRPALGDIFSDVGGFITGALGFALNTLGDLVNVPLNILSQGVDIAFKGLAGLLDNVPIMGPFLGQILLLGNAVIKFALSVPGLLLHGLGGILTNISKVLTAKNTSGDNQKNVDKAKSNIVGQAPAALQAGVKAALDATGVTGSNMTPALTPQGSAPSTVAPQASGFDTTKALTIGIPVAGATAILMMLTR